MYHQVAGKGKRSCPLLKRDLFPFSLVSGMDKGYVAVVWIAGPGCNLGPECQLVDTVEDALAHFVLGIV